VKEKARSLKGGFKADWGEFGRDRKAG